MPSTQTSRRAVYRTIAQHHYSAWPAYSITPLYDRSSLDGLAEDIRVVASTWFDYETHESVDAFAIHYPLEYVDFAPHDRYSRSNQYEMSGLFRVFLLKELHGWDHETALVEYLNHHPWLCNQLGLKTVPDQSTLWRSWHERFTADLRETIETAARTILIKAQNAGVDIPREPERKLRHYDDEPKEADPDDQAILKQAKKISSHVSRLVFPAFSLNREDGCEIHENAYWDLQTYLGLRESLAANESARSFIHESTRDRTPLGHVHREHIRDLSIPEIREMYRRAIDRLLDEIAETD